MSSNWINIAIILGFFIAAYLLHRLGPTLAKRFTRLSGLATERPSPERQATLRSLVAGLISLSAFVAALTASLALIVDAETLVFVIGLFSAAFGLGARPLVSDFLQGMGFVFEDAFGVGEKVEMSGLPGGNVEGVIEKVNLRTTVIRAPTGELLTVPNGEIRVVRNYSRGNFSTVEISIKIASSDLTRALELLETLNTQAVTELPNLLEPWQMMSQTGQMGATTEITLLTKARFGKAAEMRPRLLAFIQNHLEKADIELSN